MSRKPRSSRATAAASVPDSARRAGDARRVPGAIHHLTGPVVTAIWKLFPVLLPVALAVGCVTVTYPNHETTGRIDASHGIVVERGAIETPDGRYRTTVVRIVAPDAAIFSHTRSGEQPSFRGLHQPTVGVVTSANPWLRRGMRREPVGILADGAELLSRPRAGLWCLAFSQAEPPRLLAQAQVDATDAAPRRTIVGGFHPLVVDGEAVADRFPSGVTRAARVGVGWRGSPDDGWEALVVAVEGDRWPGRRPGVTTEELARLMVELGARDALNMDGGNSSWVQLVDMAGTRPMARGAALPVRPWLRRRGPWMLLLAPAADG